MTVLSDENFSLNKIKDSSDEQIEKQINSTIVLECRKTFEVIQNSLKMCHHQVQNHNFKH